MKTSPSKFTIVLLGGVLAGSVLLAQQDKPIERALFQSGKVLFVQDGKTFKATNDFALTQEIAISTNGTFAVHKGKARPFHEGDALGADGMLTGADGSVAPVIDHIIMKLGRPLLVVDGIPSPLTSPYRLGDGTQILPDATVIPPNGLRTRLLDGELRKLDGSVLAVKDSISLLGGKVVVQKDGSLLTVPVGQSVMMSEGTKVFGDGTLVNRDGTRDKLKEGEIRQVEGVITKK